MSGKSLIACPLALIGLLPAMVLSAVRIVEPANDRAVQLQAFTPYALLGYAWALVFAVLALGAVWRGTGWSIRGPSIALCAVAAVGLGYHAILFAPQVTDESTSISSERTLTVLAANLRADQADPVALVEAIERDSVDVAVVSEIGPGSVGSLRDAGIDQVLPFAVGEPGELYEGTMIFASSPITEVDRIPTVFDSLVVEIDGTTIFGVHPVAPLNSRRWQADHDLIAEAVDQYAPDVMVGDFNATNDHAPMREYFDRGYMDSVRFTGGFLDPTWPAEGTFGIPFPMVTIDHVLVAEDWTVGETHTAELPDSDHRLLIATVAPG